MLSRVFTSSALLQESSSIDHELSAISTYLLFTVRLGNSCIYDPIRHAGGPWVCPRLAPADLLGRSRLIWTRRPAVCIGGACRSRTNADDCLSVASLGRVEGGKGIVKGRDVTDVRPQSSIPHPPDDLIQLDTIGLDNEVDR